MYSYNLTFYLLYHYISLDVIIITIYNVIYPRPSCWLTVAVLIRAASVLLWLVKGQLVSHPPLLLAAPDKGKYMDI